MPTHCGDETCPACVIAGDFIFLAHHGGGRDETDAAHQVRGALENIKKTLESVGASLSDMVQLHLYLKDLTDFRAVRDVFYEYFENDSFPARMTTTTSFIDPNCLCMIDGIAYKKTGGNS